METANNVEVSVYKNIRKKRGLSIENVSSALKIPPSEISRMERGKRPMPRQVFLEAMQFMGIGWVESDESEMEEMILTIYDLLYEMRHDEVKCLLEDTLMHCKETEFSRRYFWHMLLRFQDAVYFRINTYSKSCVQEMNEDLISNLDVFPDIVKQIVYDLDYYHRGKDAGADVCLFSLEEANLMTVPGKLLLYHRYQKLVGNGSITEALDLYSRLEGILNQDRNFRRLIECDIVKSIVFTRIGEFQEAERVLCKARSLARKISYVRPEKRILENLIWNALRENDFQKAAGYMQEVIERFPDFLTDSNIIFLPYCLLSVGDSSGAAAAAGWIREKQVLDSLDSKILTMTEDLMKNRRKMFVRHSDLCLREAEKLHSVEIMKFILGIQAKFFESIGDWENAYKKLSERDRI